MDLISLPDRVLRALLLSAFGCLVFLALISIPWVVFFLTRRGRTGDALALATARGLLPAALPTLLSVIAFYCLGIEKLELAFFSVLCIVGFGAVWCHYRMANSNSVVTSIFDWPPSFSYITLSILAGLAIVAWFAVRHEQPWVDGQRFFDNDSCNRMLLSPDGRIAYKSGHFMPTIRVHDFTQNTPPANFIQHGSEISAFHLSPDGKLLVTAASNDDSVIVWDTATGQKINTHNGQAGAMNTLAISPNNQTILSATFHDGVRLWDARSGVETAHFKDIRGLTQDGFACFSPTGAFFAITENQSPPFSAVSEIDCVRVRDVATGKIVFDLPASAKNKSLVAAFSKDGKKLLVVEAGFDPGIRLTLSDIAQATTVEHRYDGIGPPHTVAFSSDEKEILVVCHEAATIYDTQTGVLKYKTSIRHLVMGAIYTQDGKRIVLSDYSGEILFLDRLGSGNERAIAQWVLYGLCAALILSLSIDAVRLR